MFVDAMKTLQASFRRFNDLRNVVVYFKEKSKTLHDYNIHGKHKTDEI